MIRLAIGAAGMAIIILLLGWFHLAQVDKAREDGKRDERLVWQHRQAAAEAKAEADRAAAQAEITRIEGEYWQKAATDTVRLKELEEELAREKDSSVDACAPLVGKRVRDRLDSIGRD